jgi:hypothetical protein
VEFELTYFSDGIEKACDHAANEDKIKMTILSDPLINIFTVLMNMIENLREHHGV